MKYSYGDGLSAFRRLFSILIMLNTKVCDYLYVFIYISFSIFRNSSAFFLLKCGFSLNFSCIFCNCILIFLFFFFWVFYFLFFFVSLRFAGPATAKFPASLPRQILMPWPQPACFYPPTHVPLSFSSDLKTLRAPSWDVGRRLAAALSPNPLPPPAWLDTCNLLLHLKGKEEEEKGGKGEVIIRR